METKCREIEELFKNGGEKMLAGVLLHVIVAANPIDFTLNGLVGQRCSKDVSDGLAFIQHFEDWDVVQHSKIMRLTAGRGIKCRSIQRDAQTIRAAGDDSGLHFGNIAVRVIQTFGRGHS